MEIRLEELNEALAGDASPEALQKVNTLIERLREGYSIPKQLVETWAKEAERDAQRLKVL